jgi:hypothetical protein
MFTLNLKNFYTMLLESNQWLISPGIEAVIFAMRMTSTSSDDLRHYLMSIRITHLDSTDSHSKDLIRAQTHIIITELKSGERNVVVYENAV